MSARLDEVERTEWRVYVVGTGDQLVQPSTYKLEPTPVDLVEKIARFNYQRREEFHQHRVAVVVTVTSLEKIVEVSPDAEERALKRIAVGRSGEHSDVQP